MVRSLQYLAQHRVYLMRINKHRVRRTVSSAYTVIRRVPQVVRVQGRTFTFRIRGILVVMRMPQLKHSFRPLVRHVSFTRTIRIRRRCTNLRMTVYVARIRLLIRMFHALTIFRVRVTSRVSVQCNNSHIISRFDVMRFDSVTVSRRVTVRMR